MTSVQTADKSGRRHQPLLRVEGLRTEYRSDGGTITAVDNVTFDVRRGEVLAIVGESGCGKSATAMSIMRLISPTAGRIASGRVLFDRDEESVDLLLLDESAMRSVRGQHISMIFQEPMTSLNPIHQVGDQVAEALLAHGLANRREAWDRAVTMLGKVGIAAASERARDFPHQLSGGMRQRVMIAMALMCHPKLLIADEPTTALDVTVQAQILDLLLSLKESQGMSVMLVSHDLGVVAETADRVCVMYAGQVVELAPVRELFANPLHPYTRGLLESLPRISDAKERLTVIPGSVPNARRFPDGCRFHPRCGLTRELACSGNRPVTDGVLARCIRDVDGQQGGSPTLQEAEPEHFVACWEVPARQDNQPESAHV